MEDPALSEPVVPPATNGQPTDSEEWKIDKNGRSYVPRKDGRPGVINRQGEETIAQARERDSSTPTGERRPRRKPKTPKMPRASKKVDLQQLEEPLIGALKTPGAVAMAFGDPWLFEHFETRAPYLARQLILAAQYNPWLRSRLEAAASGEEAMMQIMGFMAIGGGLIMYFAPPAIYLLNLNVPDKAREMLEVPPRREAHAPSPPPPDPADQAGTGPFTAV